MSLNKRTNKVKNNKLTIKNQFWMAQKFWIFTYNSKAPCTLQQQNTNIKTNIKIQVYF